MPTKKTAAKKATAKRAAAKAAKPRKTAAKSPVRKAAKATTTASPARKATRKTTATRRKTPATAKPKLLSGGNPQIPKGYGDAPVQAYIAAMPGWKSAVGRRLDAIIERTVPGVRKAVKWNSPFYGAADETQGWFLNVHCFTRYVKVTFFNGASLHPVPPGKSKYEHVRHLDIHEGQFDEAQFADWVKQASVLPGERM